MLGLHHLVKRSVCWLAISLVTFCGYAGCAYANSFSIDPSASKWIFSGDNPGTTQIYSKNTHKNNSAEDYDRNVPEQDEDVRSETKTEKNEEYFRELAQNACEQELYSVAAENYLKAYVIGNNGIENWFYLDLIADKLHKSDMFDLIVKLKREADKGYLESKLALVYLLSDDWDRDIEDFETPCQQWLQEGLIDGKTMVMFYYARQEEESGDEKTAQFWLEVAAEKGNQMAQIYLNSQKTKLKLTKFMTWNETFNHQRLSNNQRSFNKDEARYIAVGASFDYSGLENADIDPVVVKFIDPNGKILVTQEYPEPCTNSIILDPKWKNKMFTIGWGNDNKSEYQEGQYCVEFWYENLLIGKTYFKII